MGDTTEQTGPSELRKKASVIEPIDGDDVEGHRRKGMSLTDDETGPSELRKKATYSGSDEDDVEGHRIRTL
jgi:hypothetical protein